MRRSVAQILLIVLGSALVMVVFYDAIMTVLMPGRGAGPLSRFGMKAIWPAVLRLRGTVLEGFLTRAGAVFLLVTVFLWVLGLWVGWTLVFVADSGAVVSSSTQLPADVWETAYFSGFTIFTLGTGDFVPAGDGWRITTALASFLGLFLVTLAITYLVSVVSAVVNRRSFAAAVHLLGDSGTQLVVRA